MVEIDQLQGPVMDGIVGHDLKTIFRASYPSQTLKISLIPW
jgi:hypothetical protein